LIEVTTSRVFRELGPFNPVIVDDQGQDLEHRFRACSSAKGHLLSDDLESGK
jgi:hypothetical protein